MLFMHPVMTDYALQGVETTPVESWAECGAGRAFFPLWTRDWTGKGGRLFVADMDLSEPGLSRNVRKRQGVGARDGLKAR